METPRRLLPEDAEAWRALRLEGLRESPAAFGGRYAEEAALPIAHFTAILERNHVLGCGAPLLATAGLSFGHGNLAHKAQLWGCYVTSSARRRGLARRVLTAALAAAEGRVAELRLGVAADNAAAQALYRALGFTAYATEPRALRLEDGRLVDEVLMLLMLPRGAPAPG